MYTGSGANREPNYLLETRPFTGCLNWPSYICLIHFTKEVCIPNHRMWINFIQELKRTPLIIGTACPHTHQVNLLLFTKDFRASGDDLEFPPISFLVFPFWKTYHFAVSCVILFSTCSFKQCHLEVSGATMKNQKELSAAPSIPRRSPIQVLTWPNVA